MSLKHVFAGLVIVFIGVICSYITVPTIEYTKVWVVDIPFISFTKPFSFLALPLYALGIIVIMYGIIRKEE